MPTIENIKILQSSDLSSSPILKGIKCNSIEIEERSIGIGTQAEIYKIKSINNQPPPEDLCIKIFEGQFPKTLAGIVKQIQKNAFKVSKCNSLKALPLFSLTGELEGEKRYCYVMRKVNGKEFKEIVENPKDLINYIHLPLAKKLKFCLQFAEAMEILKEIYILHADIWFDNIIINTQTNEFFLIDLDAGVATNTKEAALSEMKDQGDTMAPEVYEQKVKQYNGLIKTVKIDRYADYWSLAAGIHFFLFGVSPYFFISDFRQQEEYLSKYKWPQFYNLRNIQVCNYNFFDDYNAIYNSLSNTFRAYLQKNFNEGYNNKQARITPLMWKSQIKNELLPAIGKQPYPHTKSISIKPISVISNLQILPSTPSKNFLKFKTLFTKKQLPLSFLKTTLTTLKKNKEKIIITAAILLLSATVLGIATHKLKVSNPPGNSIKASNSNTATLPSSQMQSTGKLNITSIPSNAKIYIEQKEKGTTPLEISLTPGNYELKITKEGYKEYTKDVKVSQGKIAKLSIALVKTSSAGVYYNIGDQVQAIDYLNVRKKPSIKGTVITVVKKGSIGIIGSACKIADNYHWWIVRWDNGYEGWSAGEYMSCYTHKPPDLSWDRRAPMPTSRAYTDSVTYNGKIYVVGGCSSPSGSQQFYNAVRTLEVYNPLNNTWKTLAPMSIPRVGPAVVALDGKIYVMGGFNRNTWSADSTMEIYNIATNTWTAGPSMLTPRSWGRAVALNGKIYVLGGVGYGYRNNCEVFDPSKGTWSRCAPFKTGRYLFAAVVAKGKIYITGGSSYDPCQTEACHKVFSDVQVYNPSTNSWTTKSPMPTPASSIDAVVVNDTILVFGGGGLCRAYDVANDRWKEKTSTQNSSGAFSMAYSNGAIYRFGGGGWGPTLDIVERCLYSLRP